MDATYFAAPLLLSNARYFYKPPQVQYYQFDMRGFHVDSALVISQVAAKIYDACLEEYDPCGNEKDDNAR